MSLIEELELDDLDEEQRALAECIGLDAYKNLLIVYAGSTITIRMPDRVTINLRNRQMREKFNGYNYSELATEYGLHEKTVRRIVSGEIPRIRAQPLDDQECFF